MPLRHLLLVLAIIAVWAFNAVAIKWGVGEIPPLFMTLLRFIIVAIVMVPFTRISRRQVPLLIKLAFTFGLMHFSLLFMGMTFTDAGTAAIIVQLGTPFAMILAVLFLGEKISLLKVAGVIISLSGMVFLSGSPSLNSIKGLIILLLSALGWAITNILIKQNDGLKPGAIAGWISLFSIPLVGLMSLLFENHQLQALAHASWKGWFAIWYSAILCSVIAYSLWYWLLKLYPVNKIIPFTLLSPALAIIFGVLFAGDQLDIYKIGGALLIISGALFATFNPSQLLSYLRRNRKAAV